MTAQDLIDAIQGFLTDVQHGNSSCRLDVKSVDIIDPKFTGGKPVLAVTDEADLIFYVAVEEDA